MIAHCQKPFDHGDDHLVRWHWGSNELFVFWAQTPERSRADRVGRIVELALQGSAVLLLLFFIGLIIAGWAS